MKVNVACLQLNAFDITRADEGLENALKMIDAALVIKPDLLVLPECIFPGYYLGEVEDTKYVVSSSQQALKKFCTKARESGIFLAVGLPEADGDQLFNAAFLINPQGKIIGVTRKLFLWHFDTHWFSSGEELKVFATAIGKIGMIVCADGRQPEITRVLALKGAEMIIDLTNLVTSGSNPQQLSNPQYEYMLPTRAVENKVWFVVANKVGQETPALLFCGKSCIISPSGDAIAVASADQEEIIFGTLDLSLAHDKQLNQYFNCFNAREPGLYKKIAVESRLPVFDRLEEPVYPQESTVFASAVQMQADCSLDYYLTRAASFIKELAVQKSSIVVFPALPCTFQPPMFDTIISEMQKLACRYATNIITSAAKAESGKNFKVSVICSPSGVKAIYKKGHLNENERGLYSPGNTEPPVIKFPFGNLGLMMDYEGVLPEVSRISMLNGADLVVWQTDFASKEHRLFSRTRAAENRIFVLTANSVGEGRYGGSLITTPTGQVAASAFAAGEQAVSAQIDLGMSRYKQIVPGTNVVLDRKPALYRIIAE